MLWAAVAAYMELVNFPYFCGAFLLHKKHSSIVPLFDISIEGLFRWLVGGFPPCFHSNPSCVAQNLFQYGGPQYAPQMYGGPGTLSPGTGPVYPYGTFTTQPLQGGGPAYPTAQYGVQAPHLVQYSPTASLTTLPQAYGGAVTIPTSAPSAGTSTWQSCSFYVLIQLNLETVASEVKVDVKFFHLARSEFGFHFNCLKMYQVVL